MKTFNVYGLCLAGAMFASFLAIIDAHLHGNDLAYSWQPAAFMLLTCWCVVNWMQGDYTEVRIRCA